MQRKVSIPEVVREARDRLRLLYGENLRHVILYGSYARGGAEEGSDVDILVVLEDMRDVEAELLRMDPIASDLSLKYDVVLCLMTVRARDYVQRNTPLLLNVRREGIPV